MDEAKNRALGAVISGCSVINEFGGQVFAETNWLADGPHPHHIPRLLIGRLASHGAKSCPWSPQINNHLSQFVSREMKYSLLIGQSERGLFSATLWMNLFADKSGC
jgi:hypothetical protein